MGHGPIASVCITLFWSVRVWLCAELATSSGLPHRLLERGVFKSPHRRFRSASNAVGYASDFWSACKTSFQNSKSPFPNCKRVENSRWFSILTRPTFALSCPVYVQKSPPFSNASRWAINRWSFGTDASKLKSVESPIVGCRGCRRSSETESRRKRCSVTTGGPLARPLSERLEASRLAARTNSARRSDCFSIKSATC